MEVRATDTNIVEVKTVAGFINYKVCRLAFKLNLPRDAIQQFRRHMDIFQLKVGAANLSFEHSAWQAEQCKTFAEIFHEAIQTGLPAIQTQHPGLYYQQVSVSQDSGLCLALICFHPTHFHLNQGFGLSKCSIIHTKLCSISSQKKINKKF